MQMTPIKLLYLVQVELQSLTCHIIIFVCAYLIILIAHLSLLYVWICFFPIDAGTDELADCYDPVTSEELQYQPECAGKPPSLLPTVLMLCLCLLFFP